MAFPCPEQYQLKAFLAGAVDPQHQPQLEEHVETCLNCQETLENVFASQTDILVGTDGSHSNSSANIPGWGDGISRRLSRALARIDALTRPDEPSVALEKIGDYQILGKIGAGGMGAVYQAYHPKLHKTVAIKVLPIEKISDDRAVARFEREIRAAGKLDHPNIVRAMDAGEDNGIHFLVMEYVDGIDLSRLSKQLGPLPVSAACELIRQAALGLDEAHASGLIHRDIKPANLILAKRSRRPPLLKILDMGLAQFSQETDRQQHELTQTGQVMGTLDYMAPEQGTDSRNVDIRADIYSLGATLYRLLTGEVLFHGEQYSSLVQKITAITTASPQPVRTKRKEIPAKLSRVVHRMLEKNPAKRFSNPQEVADALMSFAAGADLQSLLDQGTTEEEASQYQLPGVQSGGSESETTFNLPALQDTRREPHSAEFSKREDAQNKASGKQQRLEIVQRWRNRPLWLVAIGLLFLTSLAWGIMIVVQTPHGTLRVEINDPSIEVRVKGNDIVLKQAEQESIELQPGKHSLIVSRGDFSFETKQLILKQGETITLKVELLSGKVQVVSAGSVIDSQPITMEATTPEASISKSKMTSPSNSENDSELRPMDPAPKLVDAVKQGDWKRAIELETARRDLDPKNEWKYRWSTMRIMSLLLLDGNESEYRRERTSFLGRSGNPRDFFTSEQVAQSCLLLDANGQVLKRATALSSRAVELGHEEYGDFAVATAGLALYRSGKFVDSIDRVKHLNDHSDWIKRVMPLGVCAMAYHQLGESDQAVKCLAALEEALNHDPPVYSWGDWMIGKVLLREAKAKIPSSVVKQTTNVDIRLDLCASDAPASEIQAGFTRITAVGMAGDTDNGVFAPTANIDGITISVRQPDGLALQFRDRGFFKTGKLLPPYPNVLRDVICHLGEGATIEVTIENLPAGNYLVSTFHFDWHNGSNDNFFDIFIDDDSGTNQKKISNAYFANNSGFNDGESFQVKSNGSDDSVIRIVAANSIYAVRFNGITILSHGID